LATARSKPSFSAANRRKIAIESGPAPEPGPDAKGESRHCSNRERPDGRSLYGGSIMKVSECVTQDVRIVDPGETLQDAARTMGRQPRAPRCIAFIERASAPAMTASGSP